MNLEMSRCSSDICARHLDYVHVGNLLSEVGQDTLCPACNSVLVARRGYSMRLLGVRAGACATCGRICDLVGV